MPHSASCRTIGVPRSRLRMPTWISCGRSATSRSNPRPKLSRSSPGRPTIRSAWTCTPVSSRRKRRLSSSFALSCRRLMRSQTSSLNVWMPTSNCSAPAGNCADQLAQRLGQPIRDHLEVQEQARRVALEEELRGSRWQMLRFRLNVRSTNLNCRTPRSSSCCIAPRNASSGTLRTGTSSDERQNSHLNGQPREAST